MKHKKIWIYALWIGVTEAVGALSGLLSRPGMKAFASIPKSSLTPPGIVFPIVWSVLYLLMGISGARIYLAAPSACRSRGLWLYVFQLIFNFFWSLFFFNLQAFGFSFLWLLVMWGLVLMMILSFAKVDRPAAYLQIPYLAWVSFAGYLNLTTWLLNRP